MVKGEKMQGGATGGGRNHSSPPHPLRVAAYGDASVGNGLGGQNPSPTSLQVWGFGKATVALW